MAHPREAYDQFGCVARRTTEGLSYSYYTHPMPTFPPDILDCAIYLYPSVEAANEGKAAGGSGFLAIVPFDEHPVGTLYAVTNWHVAIRGKNPVVRLNTKGGRHQALDLPQSAWKWHPECDDVAVAQIGLSDDFKFKSVSTNSFVEIERDIDKIQVGQEVFLVGRFVNREGRQQNLPTVRFGHISALPRQGEEIKTGGGIKQLSFLIDARSIAGYSGSPVFVYRSLPRTEGTGSEWITGTEVRFLGLDWGHLPIRTPVERWDAKEGKFVHAARKRSVPQNSGMTAVVPAWRVRQSLYDDEEVVRMRRESEKKWLAEGGGVFDAAEPDEQASEFDRFEDLTRKLPAEVYEAMANALASVLKGPNESGLSDAELDTLAAVAALQAALSTGHLIALNKDEIEALLWATEPGQHEARAKLSQALAQVEERDGG